VAHGRRARGGAPALRRRSLAGWSLHRDRFGARHDDNPVSGSIMCSPEAAAGSYSRIRPPRTSRRLLWALDFSRDVRVASTFSATMATLRTRPSRSQSLQSRWAAISSSNGARPTCSAMSAASAANASINESATARWERLQSSCQRTTSPTRSRQLSMSCSGVSQTVSASGILARSASVRGRPSSMVKMKRPPAVSACDTS
jgi:hypothetical protein